MYKRINKASEDLEKVVIARKTSRKMRASNEVKTVAFVGYCVFYFSFLG